MKGIKVIDVGSNPEETQFGTCELCFSYGIADNPYMVLEFPDGTHGSRTISNIPNGKELCLRNLNLIDWEKVKECD